MKTKGAIVIAITSMVSLHGFTMYDLFGPTTFQEAYRDGAKARIVFNIVNDLGCPVSGANVNVFFDMADRSKGRRMVGLTDTNGVYIAEAKTKGVIEIEVSCERHYATKDEICFITMGHEHEVKNGKWQPWGMRKDVILRPIRNPAAIKILPTDWVRTKVLNQWIGFDLEKFDFIAPIGSGKVNDVEMKFDWDGMYGTKHNGRDVSLRFTGRYTGGSYVERFAQSAFTGTYAADPHKTYLQQFHYFRRPVRDSKGRMVGVDGNGFDQSKVLVGRSRCIVDETGKLVSARYFQIENFDFACSQEKEAVVSFNLIYNPSPNDTNLEPK